VFVVIKHGTRRLAHVNVTTHPSAAWTLQQLRAGIRDADDHKYLIHDRDSIFARHLDDPIRALGLAVAALTVLETQGERELRARDRHDPARVPALDDSAVRGASTLDPARVGCSLHGGRPHSALGPGVPGPLAESARTSMSMDTGVRSCERNPCWAACTTSTPSRRRRRSRMEYGPLNRMAETTEVLKSGVAPAGGHVCGAQGVQREFGKGALDLRRFCSKPMCRWGRW